MRNRKTATELLLVAIAAMLNVWPAISHLIAMTACGRPRSCKWLPNPLVAATVMRIVYPRKRNFGEMLALGD